jgi:hypothetical protein
VYYVCAGLGPSVSILNCSAAILIMRMVSRPPPLPSSPPPPPQHTTPPPTIPPACRVNAAAGPVSYFIYRDPRGASGQVFCRYEPWHTCAWPAPRLDGKQLCVRIVWTAGRRALHHSEG